MLFTIIKENSYQDSVSLMLLTAELSKMPGINQISVMMGTPANIDIMKNSGLYTEKLDTAGPNDICIVINSDDSNIVDQVMEALSDFIKNQAVKSKGDRTLTARTWDSALKKLPSANLALISIAGEYAAKEADKALDHGLNVFIFSDNVSVWDEKELKEKAKEKGLLVMGPDCGTGILSGVPIAFANTLNKGNIGIVGASGTGIQEVSTLISRKGAGVSQVIGTGGRDLSKDIGAITALSSIDILKDDAETEVVVFISKPPDAEVKKLVIDKLTKINKPVVAIFLGDKPLPAHGNMQYAWTLEEAALLAVEASKSASGTGIKDIEMISKKPNQRGIKGLYSGGTLASEAGMIISDTLGLELPHDHPAGVIMKAGAHMVIDLGDDAYTQGRPHPMIDPSARIEFLKKIIADEETAIVLMDFVIGYGGHEDVASAFGPVIKKIQEELAEKGRKIIFVGSVTGTETDPTPYSAQAALLKESGVHILDSNAQAVLFAIKCLEEIEHKAGAFKSSSDESSTKHVLLDTPQVVNVGLKHFAKPIKEHGGEAVNFTWNPTAGGNKKLAKLIETLYKM